jgi:hypothetical protein
MERALVRGREKVGTVVWLFFGFGRREIERV